MKKIKRKPNEWSLFLSEMKKQNPDLSFKELLEYASKMYRKRKQRGGALPSAPIGIAPIMRLPRKPKFELQ